MNINSTENEDKLFLIKEKILKDHKNKEELLRLENEFKLITEIDSLNKRASLLTQKFCPGVYNFFTNRLDNQDESLYDLNDKIIYSKLNEAEECMEDVGFNFINILHSTAYYRDIYLRNYDQCLQECVKDQSRHDLYGNKVDVNIKNVNIEKLFKMKETLKCVLHCYDDMYDGAINSFDYHKDIISDEKEKIDNLIKKYFWNEVNENV